MNEEIILKKFAERLTRLVKENNVDISILANKIGIKSKSTIYRYMNGEMAPKITTIKYLSEIFNVNPIWLMGYDVQMNLSNKVEDKILDLSDLSKAEIQEVKEYIDYLISKRKK